MTFRDQPSKREAPATTDARPTEAEVVTAWQGGDPRAFAVLVDRHTGLVYAFLRNLGTPPDLIPDLVQETFLNAFRGLSGFDPNRRFATWLLAIARNVLADDRKWAGRQRRQMVVDPSLDRSPPDPADCAVQQVEVQDLLARLPEPDRLLLELRFFRNIPFQEIAEVFDTTETALRMRFHRLLRALRDRWQERENVAS